MKKIVLLSLLSLTTLLSVQAQEIRANLYGGYVFDDNIDYYYATNQYINGTIKGGFQYGGSIEFVGERETGLEILYIGQSTTLPVKYNVGFLTGTRSATNDLNLNYAMIGFNRYMRDPSSKMEGYGGVMLGCLFTNATNTGISDSASTKYQGFSSSDERFCWGFKLGGNIWVAKNVGIKLQAQLLSAVDAVGGSAYYGSYYGYYTYINSWQFSFSSGLVFKFGSNGN